MTRIDNWKVQTRESVEDGHTYFILEGIVTGHPYIPDGRFVRTTSIREFDLKNGTVQTSNTLYELGDPSPAGDRRADVLKG